MTTPNQSSLPFDQPAEPAPLAPPAFISDDTRLSAAWERGDIQMAGDLLTNDSLPPPVHIPIRTNRGLGAHAVKGLANYDEIVAAAEERDIEAARRWQHEDTEAVVGQSTETAAARDSRARAVNSAYGQVEERRLGSPYYEEQGGAGVPAALAARDEENQSGNTTPRPKTPRPTIAEQNRNEKQAQAIHFKRAGRYQR